MYIKKVKLINQDCLPVLMLLYIMYIMLAYLMLFAALSNAVCLYNAFFSIYFCKCFLFSCFVLVLVKDVQCYELFGGIALKNHAFSLLSHSLFISCVNLHHAQCF